MKVHHAMLFMLSIATLVLFTGTFQPAQAEEHDSEELPRETRLLINQIRTETAPFHDLDTALDSGYGKFLDCFKLGDESGMGQHYVNGELVGDDVLDPLRPEALVYEPLADGTMVLVAFEYLVFEEQWTADDPPMLFGHEFHLKTNIPETPPVWALHLWLWTHNPGGLFADYNPLVFCPDDQPSVDMSAE